MPFSNPNINDPQYQAFVKSRLWMPTGAIDENVMNRMGANVAVTLTSGTLMLCGGLVVPANQTVTKVGFRTGSTATSGITNGWVCLVRQDGLVLAKSADDGSSAWAVNTNFERTLTTTFTPTVDTAVYVGICTVGATVGNLVGINAAGSLNTLPPAISGNSTTGLTTPASLGASAITPTAVTGIPYVYIA